MGTASDGMTGRRQAIASAIAAELQRQGHADDVDVQALAEAVEAAISAEAPVSEGRHPDQLNATNDD